MCVVEKNDLLDVGVSRLLCKRPSFVFGEGAQRCSSSSILVHCVVLSRAGIRSGHRIVKWLNASRR